MAHYWLTEIKGLHTKVGMMLLGQGSMSQFKMFLLHEVLPKWIGQLHRCNSTAFELGVSRDRNGAALECLCRIAAIFWKGKLCWGEI